MESKFIIDQEIILDENNDFLNTGVYAGTLKAMVDRIPADKSFTIGLFGEWGSGKSSVISTVKKKLESNTEFPTKFAIFDAWKYSGDAFRRSFILSLQEQLSVKLNKYDYNLYENHKQKVDDLKFEIPKTLYFIASGLLFIFGLSYIFFPGLKDFLIKSLSFLSLVIGNSIIFLILTKIYKDEAFKKILNILSDFFYNKYEVEKPLMFSPEQFSKSFGEILSKASPNKERIIVVVDNIDRCEKDYACELLSTIKGFLEHKDNVVFILPVDDGALKKHIKHSFKASDRDADEFLRKFFNVSLRIKPYNPVEIYEFAKRINGKYDLRFKDETLDLVSKEFATNPRRIIQMFNNLSSELLCFDSTFATAHETEIAKLLIIREEFPGFYLRVCKNPFVLNENNPDESLLKDEPESVINFVNKTRVLTESTSISTFNKILSNSKIFNELPLEIENFIENLNLEKIIEFIGEDLIRKETVINYLIKTLYDYTDRHLFGVSYINSLDLLIGIDAKDPLSLITNTRIEEIIRPNLAFMLTNKKNYLNLIPYSKNLTGQSRYYLKEFLILYIQEGLNKEDNDQQYSIDAFRKFIEVYDEDQSISKFSVVYEKMYPLENNIIGITELTNSQASQLINDSLKTLTIKHIRSLEETDSALIEVNFFLEKTNTTKQIENEILEQIIVSAGDLRDKTKDELIKTLAIVTSLLSKLKSQHGEDLTQLFELFTGERKMSHPTYPNSPNYDTVVNNTDELTLDDDGVISLAKFLTEIFRLEEKDTLSIYQKLLSAEKGREIVNNELMKLAELKMDLTPLKTLILSDTVYDKSHLKLLKYLIEYRRKDERALDLDNAKDIIKGVLDYYFTNVNSRSEITIFLEQLLENQEFKEILASDISSRSVDYVMTLPATLKKLCLDTVLSGDNVFIYENNQEFLTFIAESGEKSHITQLVKVIKRLILVDSTLPQALELIRKTSHFNSRDAIRLKNELSDKVDNENSDQINIVLEHLSRFIA